MIRAAVSENHGNDTGSLGWFHISVVVANYLADLLGKLFRAFSKVNRYNVVLRYLAFEAELAKIFESFVHNEMIAESCDDRICLVLSTQFDSGLPKSLG